MESIIEKIPPIHPEVETQEDLSVLTSLAERVDRIGRPRIFDTTGPDIAMTETLDVIEEVQAAVRESLRFSRSSSIEDLEDTRTTNCIGYAIVGSEALERSGIDHHIGFVNGHATIFAKIPSSEGEKLWMIDMLSPGFNQDLSDKMLLYSESDRIEVEGEESTRFFGLLNSARLELPHNKDFIHSSQEFPWISVKECYSAEDIAKNSQLFVTLMDPEAGRKVLHKYGSFKAAFREEEYQAAAQAVIDIAGAFPEVDARSDETGNVRALITHLSKAGEFETAQDVIEAFFSSYVGSDTRIYEAQGDSYRQLARRTREPRFAELARISYEESKRVKRRAMRSRLAGKMAAAEELRLDGG